MARLETRPLCPPLLFALSHSNAFLSLNTASVPTRPHTKEERLGSSVSHQTGVLKHMLQFWHAFLPCSLSEGFRWLGLGEINGLMKVVIFAVQKIRWLLTLKHVILVICVIQNQSLPSKVEEQTEFGFASPALLVNAFFEAA